LQPITRVSTSEWSGENSTVVVRSDDSPLQIVAVIDPVSEKGQEYAAMLSSISHLPVSIKIYLNPKKLSSDDIPLKRFYRLNLPAGPSFDDHESRCCDIITFSDMPQGTLLYLGLKTPTAWIVTPSKSDYDLDNIVLNTVTEGTLRAAYELSSILLEGHSVDATTGGAPRGLALELGTKQKLNMVDTIVMANLGYFQLKANPGLWRLGIKKGRSSEIFSLDSLSSSGLDDKSDEVWMTKMTGATIFPKFKRNNGKANEDVLEDDSRSGFLQSSWDRLKNWVVPQQEVNHADINIFTVASGHLYERFLSIMTASVMNHTDHTVKFWLIENFLSPSFKEFLPHLAEHYGFDYELVTYKWPHWLRGQKEKQRTIWGYKILFLDTLFPQSLDKVIFVDSDQIVRTDLKELVDMDLQGAPYGYTPMGDTREEMEGFRFWKQGYWKEYLGDLPYHISALYVVDLKRFRQLAAGDRLRQHYQMLSADSGSLANLDQDLPNHMQKSIPIFSLPEDWLWCETWCSDESLATAKTIDLCNNPLTKEPKLDRARRQVKEWTKYDDEIADLRTQVRSANADKRRSNDKSTVEQASHTPVHEEL
jgi:UDP-glucose:glycoprotein glucosyltransferase